MVDILNSRDLIQRDIGRHEDWANRKCMKVKKKHKAPCMGWNRPMHQYATGTDCLSRSFAEKAAKGLC